MPDRASLTWRMYQRGQWLTANIVMPPESAARIVCLLLREFAGKTYTPADVSVVGEIRRFSYRGDRIIVTLRRVEERK